MNAVPNKPQEMEPHGLGGWFLGRAMEWLNRSAIREAARALRLSPDERYLDIGHGTGRLASIAAARGAHVSGVDPSPQMHGWAARRVAGEFRIATADYLAWPDGFFDAAAAVHCFQFFADPQAALAEIGRVIRPGGRFVLVLRNYGAAPPDWLPNPLSRGGNETEAAIAALQEAGFQMEGAPRRLRSSTILTATHSGAARAA